MILLMTKLFSRNFHSPIQSFWYCRSFYFFKKKLEHYGIKGRSLSWFQSYLSNQKQYIEFKQDNKTGSTESSNIICGVPQGSILGALLFIIYVNDLCQTSEFLKPIMFADDTNVFCKSGTVKTLFLKVNIELEKFWNGFKQTIFKRR